MSTATRSTTETAKTTTRIDTPTARWATRERPTRMHTAAPMSGSTMGTGTSQVITLGPGTLPSSRSSASTSSDSPPFVPVAIARSPTSSCTSSSRVRIQLRKASARSSVVTPKVITIDVSASACASGSLNESERPCPMIGGSPRRPAPISSTFAPCVNSASPMMIRLSLRWSTRYVPMVKSAAAVAASTTVMGCSEPGCHRRLRRP